MNLTEATILALQGKLLKEEKEVKKEAIDIISNDTVVSVDDDKTEVITDEAVVTIQDTKEALEDNKEEETPVEEVLPEEPVEEVKGEPIEENKIISESKKDKLDLDDCIKTVAQEMGVNFNRESPFEYFYAPDSDEFIPGETPEYAVFYDKILHNMGYGENPVLDDCNAVVEEISDGKNEMELNYNGKEITLDVIAWDDLDDVKDNVESIIELLNTKKTDEEEKAEVEESLKENITLVNSNGVKFNEEELRKNWEEELKNDLEDEESLEEYKKKVPFEKWIENLLDTGDYKKLEEPEEEKVEESKDIKIGNKVKLIKTNVSYNNQTGKVVYISDKAKDPFVIELDDGRIDNFNEDEIEVLKEEKVEEENSDFSAIIKVIEDNDFKVSHDGDDFDISQYTPLGEDWFFSITAKTPDEFKENLNSYAENFDVDEEASIYIDMRGKNGVPDSISDLLEDAKWKQKTLKDLAEKINAVEIKLESMASDAADEIAHDDRYYNAGTGNIDVFLAREVADIAETLGDDYSEWLDKDSIKEIIAELKEEDYLWEPLAQATREKIEDKVDWIRRDDPASRYYDGDLSELEEGCLKTEKCNKEDKKHSIKVKVTERKLEEGSTIQVIEEYSAEDLDDQLWSGARDRWIDFTDDQKEMLIDIFNDAYAAATTIEEMPSLVTFNDFIWFDSDSYIENEEDLEESKKIEEDKLEPVYDNAASFYGKAETDGDKLYSYNTLVAEMIDGKPVVYNLQSLTTTRHVREWLKQNGFEATTKKQIAKDYGAEDIIL